MILASGLYGNNLGRGPAPSPVPLPTAGQAKALRRWASAHLPGYSTPELVKGLAIVGAHPAAYSPGYSAAKRGRERLQAELATRPDYAPAL